MDQSTRPGRGFTLIELLVVIAIIGILLAILIPGLRIAKELATGAVCLSNQRGLITGWILYANENDGRLISPLACYDHSGQTGPWVYRPKYASGANLTDNPAPATITDEDRYRGIQQGTMWPYVESLEVYHCPGDKRRSRRQQPRDCFRSYSISYAFGYENNTQPYKIYQEISEVVNTGQYFVFVEEEHNGSRYGENEGGWHLPFNDGTNRITAPNTWTFYDPLASFHNKSSTFSFADGHTERHKWTDERTLQFIVDNAEDPGSHSGIRRMSSGNQDIEWLLRHFIGGNRVP